MPAQSWGMRAEREPDLARFTERALPYLRREPVVHTFLLSALEQVTRYPDRSPDAAWYLVTGPDGAVAGAGARTGVHPLAITPMPDPALDTLADLVAAERPTVSGVVGPRPHADRFAERWRAGGGEASLRRGMRLFRLDAVTPPPAPDGGGGLRSAGDLPAHRELFVDWVCRMTMELDGEEAHEPAALVDRLVARQGIWVWCDGAGEPVSVASVTLPSHGTARLGMVYTPKGLRGRGYASACAAALSQWVLHTGVTPVLFTDLANPTSNKIYRRMGYRPVGDTSDYVFAPRG
jgi:GNAT superfamily N-acetyltransferase